MNNKIRFCLQLCISVCAMSLSLAAGARDYQNGNYPSFASSVLFSDGSTVAGKPNVVKYAIEHNNAIPLRYDQTFTGARHYLFSEHDFGSSYQVDRLASSQFVGVLSQIVRRFTCAEYRFRKRLPETSDCQGYVQEQTNHEKMPFVSGQFAYSRLEANADDLKNRVSFYAYLPAGQTKKLSYSFGAVHQLGSFLGQLADRRSLILSVHLDAYRLDNDGVRKEKINPQTVAYFIVLPKSIDIASQRSEMNAARFALEHARLLVLR